jgi:hypothetical protein
MKPSMNTPLRLLALACTLVIFPASASSIYLVTLDTSQLPASTFDLYFSLTDGSGTGDANNTVTLSNFSCTACPSSPVILTDSQFFQDSTSPVSLGPSLTFDLAFTDSLDAGGVPDTFEFKLLDPNALGGPAAIATNDPVTGEDLIVFDLTGPTSQILTYGSADPELRFSAPDVASPTPEPSGMLLLAPALALLAVIRSLRPRTTASPVIALSK